MYAPISGAHHFSKSYVMLSTKWYKSGTFSRNSLNFHCRRLLYCNSLEGCGSISNAFRYTEPPLSSQIFSKRCGATASRFSYFSCFLKSWRIFSLNWCKNWCKTGGCFFLHHKNPETVGAVWLRGFERAVCELLRTYAG